jgi:hypothetical protein
MPLIDLQTDLKSFKYGNDRPGGGDSGQPFITTNIETGATSVSVGSRNILRLFGIRNIPSIPNIGAILNRSRVGRVANEILSGDEFIRGGALGAAQASLNDTLRIGAFFLTAPKGPLFVAKQVGLQLSNPKLEVKKGLRGAASGAFNPGGLLGTLTGGLLGPTRIYNLGINTVAQIPVNAFGIHFNRHGITPIQNDDTKYEAVVTFNNNSSNSQYNRLVELTNKFELGKNEGVSNINTALNRARGFINRLATTVGVNIRGLRPQNLIINEYQGGPGSLYGAIGSTVINRTLQITNDQFKIDSSLSLSRELAGRTRDNNGGPTSVNYFNDLGKDGSKAISNYDFNFGNTSLVAGVDQNAVEYSLPSVGNPALKTYAALKRQIDQQQQLKNPNNLSGSIYYNQFGIYNTDVNHTGSKGGYSTTNIGKIGYKNSYNETVTINISDWSKASREIRVGSGRTDSINLTPLFKTDIGADNSTVTIPRVGTYNINDLCKFRIEAIDTDNPLRSVFMVFRAYLTNLSDGVDATWTDIKYAGRGENFYVYNGFSRKIQIGFKVAALSAGEMEPMYQKLNYLMSNLMPDYNNTLMRGPLVRMTVGNWIDSQPGVLNSLSYTVPQDSPWEIALNEPITVAGGGTKKELILPHVVEVSLTFTPIGSQTKTNNLKPEKVKDNNVSHIAQNYNGANSNEYNYINDQPIVSI